MMKSWLRVSLCLASITACAAPQIRVTVRCPEGEKVYIQGDLRGVSRASATLKAGSTETRCGRRPPMRVRLRAAEPQPVFDFRGLAVKGGDDGAELSPEKIFENAAPATIFIVIVKGQRTSIGSGVIVKRDGLAVTNRHVVQAVQAGGKLKVFLFDKTVPSPKAGHLGSFLKANRGNALKARVVKVHPNLDLALLQLPKTDQPYPYLKLADQADLKVGAKVIALGNPDGLSWSLTTGAVSGIRKGLIQHQAPINPGNSGGPLIDRHGKLVGINTFVRNRTEARGDRNVAYAGLGFALPADLVTAFLERDGGAKQLFSAKKIVPKSDDTSDLLTRLLVDSVVVWSKTGDNDLALRAACDVLAATVTQGRAGFIHRVDAAWINDGLKIAIANLPDTDRARAPKLLAKHWPLVLYDPLGKLWLRKGVGYIEGPAASSWAVDDQTGAILYSTADGTLWGIPPNQQKPSRIKGVSGVRSVQASRGTIYWMATDGRVYSSSGGNQKTIKLGKAPVSGSLHATQGYLYFLDLERDLFSYHDGSWANGGKPIARHVLQITAQGEHWFGLDSKRHVYSGDLGRYIDRDGDAVALRAVGSDLLVFNTEGRLYRFNSETQKWKGMAR